MTPAAALAALDGIGVRVRLEADGTVRLHAADPPPPNVLASARTHRDGIAALLRGAPAVVPNASLLPTRPGIPSMWCEDMARLAILPAPSAITPRRWTVLAATSARLLRDHGAELHGAKWDALDVFGLHAIAPTANPSG